MNLNKTGLKYISITNTSHTVHDAWYLKSENHETVSWSDAKVRINLKQFIWINHRCNVSVENKINSSYFQPIGNYLYQVNQNNLFYYNVDYTYIY